MLPDVVGRWSIVTLAILKMRTDFSYLRKCGRHHEPEPKECCHHTLERSASVGTVAICTQWQVAQSRCSTRASPRPNTHWRTDTSRSSRIFSLELCRRSSDAFLPAVACAAFTAGYVVMSFYVQRHLYGVKLSVTDISHLAVIQLYLYRDSGSHS